MDIYDKTKKRIYTYDLSTLDEIYSLDAYNFIDENHKEQTCFTAICSAGTFIYRITYLSNEKRIIFTRIELPSTRLVKYEKEEDSISVVIGDEKEEEISTLPFG